MGRARAMSNDKAQMPKGVQNPNDKRKYDLEERITQFGEATIELVKTFRQDPVNSPLVSQLVRAATSVGANHMGAYGAGSKRDFQHKISI